MSRLSSGSQRLSDSEF